MSAISLKSITGITSITTPAGVDNQLTLHTNNTTEAVKLDNAGNFHFHNHLNITGISTAANFKTGTSNLHNTGLNVQDLDVDGHTNLDNVSIAGVVTATSYYGDGSNLSNVISGVDVKFEGASVGTGVTMLNFVGFNTVTPPASGLSTITSGQNLTIGVRSGSAVEASLTGTSFNVIARSGGNISINI